MVTVKPYFLYVGFMFKELSLLGLSLSHVESWRFLSHHSTLYGGPIQVRLKVE